MIEDFLKLRKLLELCFDVQNSGFLKEDFVIEGKKFMIYSSIQTNLIHVFKTMFLYKSMRPLRKELPDFVFHEEAFFLPEPDVCYELISIKMTSPIEVFKKILQLI